MRTSIAAYLLLLSCAAALVAPLRAQVGGPCPHQRASLVPGTTQDLTPWRTCYMQVHVFGIVIAIPWSRCPTGHVHVPTHWECLGQSGPGTRCEEAGIVPVELETCRCVPHVGPLYSFSSCECHDAGAMGFVTTGQTVECN